MSDRSGGISRPRRRLTPDEVADLKRSIDAVERDERAAGLLRRLLLDQVVNEALDTFDLGELLGRLIDLATSVLNAERGTIFLHDEDTGELLSRVTGGGGIETIRLPASRGIAGHVFTSGEPALVADAYADPRFFLGVDEQSGFRTRTIVCAPILAADGAPIGVSEILNKRDGLFDTADLRLLEAINAQAAAGIGQVALVDRLNRLHDEDRALLRLAEEVTSDLRLDEVLRKIVAAATRMLDAERSTLFLHEPEHDELWARVAEDADATLIRIGTGAGIAGHVFSSGEAVVVRDAYADPRFAASVDRRTGFRTRDLVCVPVRDRGGIVIGVLQVLNKRRGAFGRVDLDRLQALAGQVGAAIGNARMLRDVIEVRQHSEALMRALTNGVIALDADGRVMKVNEAARRILQLPPDRFLTGPLADSIGAANPWLVDSIGFVAWSGRADMLTDVELRLADGAVVPVNATISPIPGDDGSVQGIVVSLEDLSREKRMRAVMGRYIAREVLDKVLAEDAAPARETTLATVLFSDIRQFTTISEAQSAADTASMLDEYFNAMVRIVESHGGTLDKFIGDAIMAVFGAVRQSGEDPVMAVRAATGMIQALRDLNDLRAKRGLERIDIGIGLATGEVVAGSIGAATRMDYTVIGDSVNLAARLESATKHYGAAILLDEATAGKLPPESLRRQIDLLRVKGKTRPVAVYESLDHVPDEARARVQQMLPLYQSGLDAYRRREWSVALASFRQALEVKPGDGPAWVYADRCLYYRRRPPPDNWDGVWQMREK